MTYCARGLSWFWIALVLALAFVAHGQPLSELRTKVSQPLYQFRAEHDPDGTGKFYLGREIAQVMGHQGAEWLERAEREEEEQPGLLIDTLGLKSGQVVADIGAGTGYITRRLAEKVGTNGWVYAVDIQPEMVELLKENLERQGLRNVRAVLGTVTDPKLPTNRIDLAVMVDVYHEFSHPHEMMQAIRRSLKPGGRLAFVEYRAEDPLVPIKRVHKMSEAQVRKEAERHALTWRETIRILPRQHIIIFEKPRD